ncbi:hypothetical protein CEXT_710731 [Caerostris extrusa]|uniref:Uncharacterized protein n=1 Tax=Caerostris extrusa TaxID=172846 RepID=A0AAV4NWH1_CAEEX|nr:hypothetical protein CEXT_710731 [Caerostris extrusa]
MWRDFKTSDWSGLMANWLTAPAFEGSTLAFGTPLAFAPISTIVLSTVIALWIKGEYRNASDSLTTLPTVLIVIQVKAPRGASHQFRAAQALAHGHQAPRDLLPLKSLKIKVES